MTVPGENQWPSTGSFACPPSLVPSRPKVADQVSPICDRNGEICDHRAREVDRHRLIGADERVIPGVDEPGEPRQLSEHFCTAGTTPLASAVTFTRANRPLRFT